VFKFRPPSEQTARWATIISAAASIATLISRVV
jgi:hypothetical protein